MRKGISWRALVASLVITLLAGCSPQPSPTQQPTEPAGGAAKTGPDIKLKVPESIQAQATPAAQAAAEPTAATKTAPAAPSRVEPQGRAVYNFHTSLTPAWLDPQESPALITPYHQIYAVHDALVKHLPGQPLAPSLAESYEMAPDFKSVTFKLREGIKFHNGDPVTPEDVKFTFENYRGANATVLHDKTERIEAPDARTVKFVFKEPFLDFMILYGSPATGAGWVVPKKYYEQVGPDGFKQNPIGAGPFKFVRQTAGQEIELEAFTDYWRKAPHIKTLIIRGVPEDATRVAQLQTGEADFMNNVTGPLIDTVRNDPNLQLAPVRGAPFWLEMPGYEKPESPFHDKRVREAVSLALDRQALNEAETAGLSIPLGNWIPNDWPGALELPPLPHDVAKAKQLMAEAGHPDGFEVEQLTPLPNYFSLGERVIGQLREIGIRTKLNTMERAAFFTKLTEGPDALPGIILNISGSPGDAASRIRSFAICNGSSSRTCDPKIDEPFQTYEGSTDPQERERLLNEIQQYMYDNYIFIGVYRQAFINAQGPRIANQWEEIIGAIPQYGYVGPYEDIKLKE